MKKLVKTNDPPGGETLRTGLKMKDTLKKGLEIAHHRRWTSGNSTAAKEELSVYKRTMYFNL